MSNLKPCKNMNIFKKNGIVYRFLTEKNYRVMRLPVLLLTIALCRISAVETYAQDTQITLSMNNVTVKEILRGIERNSDYTFFYNDKAIDTSRKTSIHATNRSIENILAEILPECTFQIDNRRIILIPGLISQQQTLKIVTGTILDDFEKPLIGATVKIKDGESPKKRSCRDKPC
jgi:hypothetical protein